MTTIVRAPRAKDKFTILQNAVLQDRRLSFKARGLLCLLLSMPDDWTVHTAWLQKAGPDGKDAVRGGLKELETVGYIRRVKRQDAAGRWSTTTYVYEEPLQYVELGISPVDELGVSGSPESGFPAPVNPHLYKGLSTKDVPGFNLRQVQVGNPQKTATGVAVCPTCNGTQYVLDASDFLKTCPTCNGEGLTAKAVQAGA